MAAAIRLSQQHSCSFNHLVGAAEQRRRHFPVKRLGGLEVEEHFEFRKSTKSFDADRVNGQITVTKIEKAR